jgi:hypothetical protein
MKIPSQLVHLGDAIALVSSTWTWTWALKDGVSLYSNPSGDKLIIMYRSKLGKPSKMLSKAKRWDTTKAKRLYARFQAFKSDCTRAHKLRSDPNLKKVGTGISIKYRSDKWTNRNVRYYHDFKHSPSVWVDNPKNPKVLIISSSKIRINRRGIIG